MTKLSVIHLNKEEDREEWQTSKPSKLKSMFGSLSYKWHHNAVNKIQFVTCLPRHCEFLSCSDLTGLFTEQYNCCRFIYVCCVTQYTLSLGYENRQKLLHMNDQFICEGRCVSHHLTKWTDIICPNSFSVQKREVIPALFLSAQTLE